MSDSLPADAHPNGVVRLIESRRRDIGGFMVQRLLPVVGTKRVGPWVFFDHMGPVTLNPGPGMDIKPHPHIGLATVTYLFEGEAVHRDSLGSEQVIRPGDLNLMIAGRGITHSEREAPERQRGTRLLHGLQLWLALPESEEDCEPAFEHYPDADIPRLNVEGVPVRVMMGRAFGEVSPVRTLADTLYVEARMTSGQTLPVPYAEERALYVVEGAVVIGDTSVKAGSLAVLSPEADVRVRADVRARLAIIGGEAFNPRFIDWNFVATTTERIEQARDDWRHGRFPKVVGDEDEFVPLPGEQ